MQLVLASMVNIALKKAKKAKTPNDQAEECKVEGV